MADSAVGDDVSSSAHKKRLSRSKELLDPGTKPDLMSRLKELGAKKKVASPLPVMRGPPRTFRVEGSSVLSKVKHFLPELEQADEQLKVLLADSQSRQALDMEEIEEGRPCIEMNMAVIPVDASSSGGSEDEGDEHSDSSSSESSDSDEADALVEKRSGGGGGGEGEHQDLYLPLKIRQRHKKPLLIEEVEAV